jgi:hypothetical protein
LNALRAVVAILCVVGVLAAIVFYGIRSRRQQALVKTVNAPEIRPWLKVGEVPRIQAPADSRDFVDLRFGVGQLERKDDGTIVVPLKALFEQQEIGFSVKVPAQLSAGLLGRGSDLKVKVVPEGIHLLRTGDASDRFVTALERLYGIGSTPLRMAQQIRTTAINLAGNDQNLDRDPIKLKLFFNDHGTNQEDHAECYLKPRSFTQLCRAR